LFQVLERNEPSLDTNTVRKAAEEEALDTVGDVVQIPRRSADDARRERRALPQVLVADFRDRRTEAALEGSSHRQQLLALALEAPVVREMKMDG
jgi:uncharacterized protein (UPF0218 family)